MDSVYFCVGYPTHRHGHCACPGTGERRPAPEKESEPTASARSAHWTESAIGETKSPDAATQPATGRAEPGIDGTAQIPAWRSGSGCRRDAAAYQGPFH